jgi:alpha-1,2-glucosyltransferase
MLYLSACIAFFSAPLLYPYGIGAVKSVFSTVFNRSSRQPSKQGTIFRSAWFKVIIWTASLLITLIAIRYNTIIHRFILADNRHYMFYVFRYTILRHPLIKYLLAPIYLFSFYLLLSAMSNPKPVQKSAPKIPETEAAGTSTSFAIIWLVSTALSLVTAPLVEPRYFIIPWVIWRLHVPRLPLKARTAPSNAVKYWLYAGHDHRLWLETIWFLAINVVTGYMFLFRGFSWVQEPGKVQRFMW